MNATERIAIEEREHGFAVVAMRELACTREKAFDAWTTAEGLNGWFTTGAEVDLREGGEYRNGDTDHGKYVLVDRPHAVSFTWEQKQHKPGSVVSLEFKEHGGKVRAMLTHAFLTQEDAKDLANGGWDWAMDSFVSWVETGQAISYNDWKTGHR
jgi:uncharacterized protein YndB with AHSA1/START domain